MRYRTPRTKMEKKRHRKRLNKDKSFRGYNSFFYCSKCDMLYLHKIEATYNVDAILEYNPSSKKWLYPDIKLLRNIKVYCKCHNEISSSRVSLPIHLVQVYLNKFKQNLNIKLDKNKLNDIEYVTHEFNCHLFNNFL